MRVKLRWKIRALPKPKSKIYSRNMSKNSHTNRCWRQQKESRELLVSFAVKASNFSNNLSVTSRAFRKPELPSSADKDDA